MLDQLADDTLLRDLPLVDGYRILEPCILVSKLGAGAMGCVYRARHLNLDIEVAVKCMRSELALASPECVSRFHREARLAAQVKSENLVGVLDVNERYGLHYLVMELVDGETVQGRVRRTGALTEREAVSIALRAARGLAAAHAQGVLHRDIKPENILISRDGKVKVADLGLAKGRDRADSLATSTNAVMGTPQYMPPEQYESSSLTSAASDVYSLGCTIYYMLSARHPFPGETVSEIMRQVILGSFPDLREDRPDVTSALMAVLDRATAHAAVDRYDDASKLVTDLEILERELGGPADLTWTGGASMRDTEDRIPSSVVARLRGRVENQAETGPASSHHMATIPATAKRRRFPVAAGFLAVVIAASVLAFSFRDQLFPSSFDVEMALMDAETSRHNGQLDRSVEILEEAHAQAAEDPRIATALSQAHRQRAEELERLGSLSEAFQAASRAVDVAAAEGSVDRRQALNLKEHLSGRIHDGLRGTKVTSPKKDDIVAQRELSIEGSLAYDDVRRLVVRSSGGQEWEGTRDGRRFAVALRDLDEGRSTLMLVVSDSLGHDATLPLDFKVDVTAPVLACRIGGQSLSTAHAQPHAASSGDQDASNFVWARPPIALSGTVEDDSMVALHVNGHPVTIHPDGRTWNTSLDLKDGSHRIVIQATDGGGNVTTNHYDVRVDSVSPTVDIDGLAAEDRINADRVALQIVARDDQRLAAVMIDGRPVEASRFTAGARFSHVLDGLAEGRNQLHVVARDAAGNETEELVSFLVDRTAPKGRVVLPIAGSTVAPGPVVVEVEVDDEDLSEVTINGATATSIGPRRFRITVAGAEGQSLDIAADCRDAAGNVGACPSIQCRVGVACQDCGGDKHCKHCDGEGQTRDDCTYCKDGLRTESCRPCSGQGHLSCSGCGGDGLIDEPCRPCGATGQVRCRNRHGRCVTCKGKKKIRPPRKRGDVIDIFLSLIPCGDCKGTGNAQCDLCNGSLWTTCGTCNGGKTRPERCRQCARSGPTTQCTHCHGDRSTQVTCNRPNCHGGQVSHDCPHCDRGACRSCEGRGYRE